MNESIYMTSTAGELAKAIKQGTTNPQQLIEIAMSRVEQVNDEINAVTHVFPDLAQQFLKRLSGNEPFYGVPIVTKELGQTIMGLPMRSGSRFLADNIANYQSDFMSRILALGFIPIAMTNTPEFGLSFVTESSLFGPCRNPYDLTRTSGGSSGGAAAAVATGITPLATASDGGGSIRIPAACCGLIGFKPSSGKMPSGPISPELWSGMATNNIVSRYLEDTMNLYQYFDSGQFLQQDFTRPTFIVGEGLFTQVPEHEPFSQAFQQFKSHLTDAGFDVQPRNFDLPLDQIGEAVLTLIQANLASDIRRIEKLSSRKAHQDQFEPATWSFYQAGKQLSATDLLHARDQLYQLLRPLRENLSSDEVLISPVLAQPPIPIGYLSTFDELDVFLQKHLAFCPYTGLYNQAGMPAISLPYRMIEGLNFSVQLASAKGTDHYLLAVAKRLMDASITREWPVVTPE